MLEEYKVVELYDSTTPIYRVRLDKPISMVPLHGISLHRESCDLPPFTGILNSFVP